MFKVERNSIDLKSLPMFRVSKMPVADKGYFRVISPAVMQRARVSEGSTFHSSLIADFSNQFSKKDYDIGFVLKKNKKRRRNNMHAIQNENK